MDTFYVTLLLIHVLYFKAQAFPDNRTRIRHSNSETVDEPDDPADGVYERRLHDSFIFTPVNTPVRMPDTDGKIIFPDDETNGPNFSLRAAPVCKNLTFCEQVQDYPKDLVKVAVRLNTDLKYLASVDEPVETTEIGQRIDAATEDTLCLTRETVVFPKSAENKQREWRFIVNDDSFPQGVRIETCMSEESGCRIIEGFAEGYRTSCKQKYIYRQLASISSDGSMSPDFFKFPSSCCCHVYFVGSPMERVGFIGRSRDRNNSKDKNKT